MSIYWYNKKDRISKKVSLVLVERIPMKPAVIVGDNSNDRGVSKVRWNSRMKVTFDLDQEDNDNQTSQERNVKHKLHQNKGVKKLLNWLNTGDNRNCTQ